MYNVGMIKVDGSLSDIGMIFLPSTSMLFVNEANREQNKGSTSGHLSLSTVVDLHGPVPIDMLAH